MPASFAPGLDPLEPFGGQAWPRGSGEVEAGFDDDRQDQTYAPVTVVQAPVDTEEPFFPAGSEQSAYREQGYEGSGATRRFVTAAEILGGSAYGSPGSAWNDEDE